jgi:hypothetical protein
VNAAHDRIKRGAIFARVKLWSCNVFEQKVSFALVELAQHVAFMLAQRAKPVDENAKWNLSLHIHHFAGQPNRDAAAPDCLYSPVGATSAITQRVGDR